MKKYKNSKIFIAGHNGLVGSAIYNKLKLEGYKKIIVKNRKDLDLKNSKKVFNFLKKKKTRIYNYSCCKSRRYQSK